MRKRCGSSILVTALLPFPLRKSMPSCKHRDTSFVTLLSKFSRQKSAGGSINLLHHSIVLPCSYQLLRPPSVDHAPYLLCSFVLVLYYIYIYKPFWVRSSLKYTSINKHLPRRSKFNHAKSTAIQRVAVHACSTAASQSVYPLHLKKKTFKNLVPPTRVITERHITQVPQSQS